jgi:hypothetical protein
MWTVGDPTSLSRSRRDERLDFFRGVALTCIFIDHIPGNPLAHFTLQNYGFSDAAEVFVLISGISCALAYAGRTHDVSKILRRACTIYLVHISLLIGTAGLVGIAYLIGGHTVLLSHPVLAPFLDDATMTLMATLMLSFQPEFMDILPLYVVMLLGLAVVVKIAERSITAVLILSCAIWFAANVFEINLPCNTRGSWFFNPFAWQFLMCIGVVIGLRKMRGLEIIPLRTSRWGLAFAIVYLLAAFLSKRSWAQETIQAMWTLASLPPPASSGEQKTFLSLWRIGRDATWLRQAWWAKWLTTLGKMPLKSFAVASIVATLAHLVLEHIGVHLVNLIAVDIGGLGVLYVLSMTSLFNDRPGSLICTARPVIRTVE